MKMSWTPYFENTNTVSPRIIAPQSSVYNFSSLTGITLYIEIVQHSNYRSTSQIWFSKIFIFSKFTKYLLAKSPGLLFEVISTILPFIALCPPIIYNMFHHWRCPLIRKFFISGYPNFGGPICISSWIQFGGDPHYFKFRCSIWGYCHATTGPAI